MVFYGAIKMFLFPFEHLPYKSALLMLSLIVLFLKFTT